MKNTDNAPDLPTLKPSDSAGYNKDGKETDRRNGIRGRGRLYFTTNIIFLSNTRDDFCFPYFVF